MIIQNIKKIIHQINQILKYILKAITHKIDALNINIEKLCILDNNPTFYDDIKSYLKSVKAATDSNNKIDQNKIVYLPNVYNCYDNKKKKQKN